jgi:glycosyltransferase involved in cell wall biosynthesis
MRAGAEPRLTAERVRPVAPPASAHAGRTWESVSAIVPTRDRPDMVERAVRSILGQDYPGPVECVVVYDRGEPRIPDVPVPEGRTMRAIANTRTPGLSGSRNSGILASEGELVAHCDDDDEWLPSKLRRQVEATLAHPEASVVATGIHIHWGKRVITRLPLRTRITFEDLLRSRVKEVNSSNLLVRRSTLMERIGLLDETLPGSHAEDYDFLLRAARHGPIVVVPEPLARIHWHRDSYFSDQWGTLAAALIELLRRYPEFRRTRPGYARICGQIAFARAATGERREAARWIARTIGADWREGRAYLAGAVAGGLVPARTVLQLAHQFGKGI